MVVTSQIPTWSYQDIAKQAVPQSYTCFGDAAGRNSPPQKKTKLNLMTVVLHSLRITLMRTTSPEMKTWVTTTIMLDGKLCLLCV